MKIKISTIIDVPENSIIQEEKYRFGSAVQCIFDGITNYVLVQHLMDSLKWLAISKGDEKSTDFIMHEHHNDWANICKNLDWKYEEVKE